jgi:hypothetical protein
MIISTLILAAAGACRAQVAITVAPAHGEGEAQLFTLDYRDPAGPAHIAQAHFWVMAADGKHCYAMYQRDLPHAGVKPGFYLADDAGNIVAHPPGVAGADTVLNNSVCSLAMREASATDAGAALVVGLPLTFHAAQFHGPMELRATTYSLENVSEGILTIGSYTVTQGGGGSGGGGTVTVGPSGALEVLAGGAIDIVPAISPRKDAQGDWTGLQYFRGAFVLGARTPRPACTDELRGYFVFERNAAVARYKRVLWFKKRVKDGQADRVLVCEFASGAYVWAAL